MNKKRRLIVNANKLKKRSLIDLFNFITSTFNLNYMENTNGIFFSLNDIDEDCLDDILDKVTELINKDVNASEYFDETSNIIENIIENDSNEEDDPIIKTENENFQNAFEYDKNILKEIDNHVNKINKKSIHIKYSLAKKKYNKQMQADNKKIENNDLNELTEDIYIC